MWGSPACPGKGLECLLSWKDGPTSLKQYPSQGLLIPSPAANHVNPDLFDRAVCPGAANPPACGWAGAMASTVLTLPARKGSVQRSGQQGSTLGRRERALQFVFKIDFKDHTCDVHKTPTGRASSGDGRPGSCVSLRPPGASVSFSVKGERNIYLGTK